MRDRRGILARSCSLAVLLAAGSLSLSGCSRASLLGGPGPEVVHHESPAETERLAVAEPVGKYKSTEACKARLAARSQEHGGGEIVQIAENEFRSYASQPWGEGEVHHEYTCVGKILTERSWKTGGTHAAPVHHASEVEHSTESHPESETAAPH